MDEKLPTETIVVDNLFTDDVINMLNECIKKDSFFGWKSRPEAGSKIYHSNYVVEPGEGIKHFYDDHLTTQYKYDDLIAAGGLIADLAAYISRNFFNGKKLSRVYGNIQHFGQETYIHRDYPVEYFDTAKTAVLYLNDVDLHHGGDVVIMTDDEEIEKAVRIKKGRLIVFNGCKLHGVRPLSKYFEDSRNAIVFGLEV